METLDGTEIIPKAAAPTPKELSRWASIGIVGAAVLLGAVVLNHGNHSPRTDDAEVFAQQELVPPNRLGQDDVQRLALDLLVQQRRAEKDRHHDGEERDRRQALNTEANLSLKLCST